MSFVDDIISRALLVDIGSHALYIIKTRTLQGEFLPGSTGSGQYSTTPMPLPLGALQKSVRTGATLKAMVAAGEAYVFQSKAGRKWIILEGGYKKLRELAKKEADHVTLNWSGSMMRNLKIISVNPDRYSVTLGFDEASARRKARYHNELGAGRKRVTHKFLGLTDQEIRELGDVVERAITYQ